MHDPGNDLHRRDPAANACANCNRHVHPTTVRSEHTRRRRRTDRAARLQPVDDLHRPDLGAPSSCLPGKSPESIERRDLVSQIALHFADEVEDMRVLLDDHQFGHPNRTESCHAPHVIAARSHQHEMLGPSFSSPAARRQSGVGVRVPSRRRVPAMGRTMIFPSCTARSNSGELPTSSVPSSCRWNM